MLSVLDPLRISSHTQILASVECGTGGTYFGALNRIQSRCPIEPTHTDTPRLVFSLDDRTKDFLTRVLAESHLPAHAIERLSPRNEEDARAKIVKALRLLESYHPEMPMNVRRLIGTFLFARVANVAGGSSIDALGTVWISPHPGWTVARYAECVCHELVHQALFLEDMLAPIFQDVDDRTLVVSPIRRSKRPFESSFHAAVVAGALIEMHLAIGTQAQAEGYSMGLAMSVAEFAATPQYLTSRGLDVLAELDRIASLGMF